MTYSTIGKVSQEISQRAFLKMYERTEAYHSDAPTMWDVDFKTAVAQAEIEDREKGGKFYKLAFHFLDEETNQPSSDYLVIETTRPELIAADVAIVVHPDDTRYTSIVGKKVLTPLFDIPLEIKTHALADPEKGSGAAMVSTWGDITDITWWRELQLPVHSICGRDGCVIDRTDDLAEWGSVNVDAAQQAYGRLVGKYMNQARKIMEEMLRESGALLEEPREIMHPVKFYEKGERPLEIVASRQWYVKNGGRDSEIRNALKERGSEMVWHPPFMESRYQNWIDGLNGDWLVSRQRYFGVPIPIFYGVDADGNVDYSNVIVPSDEQLPIDPSSEAPVGYEESQRNQPNGFVGDPDIFDTWATSSLTPQIAGQWSIDDELFSKVFPMDLRPQAHEIIRTWLFSTALRAHSESNSIPFKHILISGWILDPDRKKMSKSKGNTITPMALLDQYGSDAVRYWAASGRPGVDTAFDEGVMKIGKRLVTKILNATKFVLTVTEGADDVTPSDITHPLDQSYACKIARELEEATNSFESFDYARVLQNTETSFWDFCDNYLEIVKARAYGSQGDIAQRSAHAMLRIALRDFLKLFAPFLPFVTEEAWSWFNEGSIHIAPWPTGAIIGDSDRQNIYQVVRDKAVVPMRTVKSEMKISMKTEVTSAKIHGGKIEGGHWKEALGDIKDVCNISDKSLNEQSIINDELDEFFVASELQFAAKND
jgi:valyl-tRNA synthetase